MILATKGGIRKVGRLETAEHEVDERRKRMESRGSRTLNVFRESIDILSGRRGTGNIFMIN